MHGFAINDKGGMYMNGTTIISAICVSLLGLQQLFYGYRYRSGKAPYFLYPEYPKNHVSEEDLPQYTSLMGLSCYAGGAGFLLTGLMFLFVQMLSIRMIPVVIGICVDIFIRQKVRKKYGKFLL